MGLVIADVRQPNVVRWRGPDKCQLESWPDIACGAPEERVSALEPRFRHGSYFFVTSLSLIQSNPTPLGAGPLYRNQTVMTSAPGGSVMSVA